MINRDRIINFAGIASSDRPPFGYDESHFTQGWEYRAEHFRRVQGEHGIKDTALHLPGGYRVALEHFEIDAHLYHDAHHKWIGSTMEPALRPLIQGGHRFKAYLGPWGTHGMTYKVVNRRPVPMDWDDKIRRFLQVVKPYVDMGMELMFDACVRLGAKMPGEPYIPADERWEIQAMRMLRAMGVKVWIEARPENAPHWEGWPVCSPNQDWIDSASWPGASQADKFPEVLRFVTAGDTDQKRAAIAKVQKDGHWAGVDVVNSAGVFGETGDIS